MKSSEQRANEKKYRNAMKEAERKLEVESMKADANTAVIGMREQCQEWYEKYQLRAAEGDFKQANWAFNMFKFMEKIYVLAQRYVEILGAQTAINEVFHLLQTTNKRFGAIAKLASGGLTRSVIRNLKKFKRSLRRFTESTERIMEVLDSIFDDKKKRGKKAENGPSDEEIFRNNVANNQDVINAYEHRTGAQSTVTGTGTATAPSAPSAPKGGSGSAGGIGDPNDF